MSYLQSPSRALLYLAIGFAAATLAATPICSPRPLPSLAEEYDPELQSIRTVDEAVAHVRRTRRGEGPRASADAADEFVRRRFFHGYSQFRPCDNWIAHFAGYLWFDLRAPVRPNDILSYRRAACSQQAIVFQAIVNRLGLNAASVRLDGHFVSAVAIGNEWFVYDSDKEIEPRSFPLRLLVQGDPQIEHIYGQYGQALRRQAAQDRIRVTDFDGNPAPRAALFHEVTRSLSRYGWAILLALSALLRFWPTLRAQIAPVWRHKVPRPLITDR